MLFYSIYAIQFMKFSFRNKEIYKMCKSEKS